MDYRKMFDSEYIGAWDLPRDVTVTIASVKAGQLTGQQGRKAKKPILRFERTEKGMAANKTNCKIIAAMYGTNTREWVGKRITLYATTTEFGGETVECIRVRPQVPADAKRSTNSKAAEPEPGIDNTEHAHDDSDDLAPEQEAPAHE